MFSLPKFLHYTVLSEQNLEAFIHEVLNSDEGTENKD